MEKIIPTPIESEIKDSYIDYAMSVIVGRAIPDARDGLKPVHRRILYAMHKIGLQHNKPHRKSATIIGEVIGKYHPHGDQSVYDALVRLTQPFSLRYPLIDGQGNFGSIDGDNAAAYRYTEARLSEISEFMLRDIDKNTVQFVPNFDGKLNEPTCLPSMFPNALVNGSSGIAVGMATNIPPHNLNEIVDALIALIGDENTDIFQYIKGPDFPTGGIVVGEKEIKEAYQSGKGKITLKGKAEIKSKGEKEYIFITEIPYQVNKSELVAEIGSLVKTKKIDGISDIRDESDKTGIRIVVELKKGAHANAILNTIYNSTSLSITYGMIFLVLVEGVPKILNMTQLLQIFINHRYEIVKRRTEFELKEAENKAHILEGLKIAIKNIDAIIKIIKEATDTKTAQELIIKNYKLSEIQTKAILDMKLSRLVKLEQDKIENEYMEIIKEIEKLKSILASREGIMEVIKNELIEIKQKFGDKRRTQIVKEEKELELKDLIPNERVLITLTEKGYIKITKLEDYTKQKRAGVGVKGITLLSEDKTIQLVNNQTHSYILFFTDTGKCYCTETYKIPLSEKASHSRAITNILNLKNEKIVYIFPIIEFGGEIIIITRKGRIKKMELDKLINAGNRGIIATSLYENDTIASVSRVAKEILIVTKQGKIVHFKEKLHSMGRTAHGVIGIKLKGEDEVLFVRGIDDLNKYLLIISKDGYAKRVKLNKFKITNRATQGVICSKREIAACDICDEDSEAFVITEKGITLRTKVKEVRETERTARGVKIISLKENDKIASVTII